MKVYTSAAKWMCLLLAVSLFFAGMPIAVDSADDGTTASGTACYGYTTLTTAQKTIYRRLHASVQASEPDTFVNVEEFNVTSEELEDIIAIYVSDHPEAFWFCGTFICASYIGDTKIAGFYPIFELDNKFFTSLIYNVYGEPVGELHGEGALAQFKQNFTNKVNALIGEMALNGIYTASDAEKSLWLHDKVTEIVTYTETPNDQTAYGALVEGKAVCAGYTALYQYLLQRVGIRSFRVAGYAQPGDDPTYIAHAWNLVWIGDSCVYTDVTWDDALSVDEKGNVLGEILLHSYYALGYDDFYRAQHFADDLYKERLPKCTDSCDILYRDILDVIPKGSEGFMTALTACAVLSADGKSYSIKVIDQTAELEEWVGDETNLLRLTKMLGVEGSSERSILSVAGPIGTEHHLIFQFTKAIEPRTTVEGKIELGSISPDEIVRISFIPEGSDTEVYGVQKYACAADYSVRNLPSGNYTVRVSAAKHVTREYTITVP